MAIHRILIRTHHMTSRKKITAITKAAKKNSCAVVLKTGRTPGVMMAEGEEAQAGAWLEVVKKLRYKDFQLMKIEVVDQARLNLQAGAVKEITKLKELGEELDQDKELKRWWREHMGFKKGESSQNI